MPTTEIALQEELTDRTDIKVYSDGSGIDGKIGASAVLIRGGEVKGKLRYQLGSDKQHTVYEGEGIGMVLGLELICMEQQVIMVSMGIDNQAAIMATGLSRPAPSHYIWDLFHKHLTMVTGQHKDLFLTVVWTPGHTDIEGNELADVEAKHAVKHGSSPNNKLPAPPCKLLP